MAVINTTAIASQLKRVYGNKITDLFGRHVMTYNQFIKSPRAPVGTRPGGTGYRFSVRQGSNEAVRAQVEGAILPEPLAGAGVQGEINPKLIYGVMRMSGLAIEAGKGNIAAFVDAQGDATMDLYKSVVQDLNRQCWGDGHGKIGIVDAEATYSVSVTTPWTVGFANDLGTRYFRKGMICDVYESGGGDDDKAYNVRVSAINPNTSVVTFESCADVDEYAPNHPTATGRAATNTAHALSANDVFVRQGARADSAWTIAETPIELVGLLGQYDDGTLLTTHCGISTTTYPEYKANVMGNSDVNRELSIDLMLASMDMTAARSGETPNLIRMGMGQRRKYFGLLAPDVRFSPQVLRGGYEQLDFSQNSAVKIVVDPQSQPNRLFFEVDGVIKKYELTPIGWGGFDSNKMHWRQDYDEATMFLRTYTELGCEHRPALTVLEDLTEPASATSPF